MVGLIGLGAALCACVLTVIVAFPVRALDFWAATYDYGLVQRVAWLLFQIAVIPLAFRSSTRACPYRAVMACWPRCIP